MYSKLQYISQGKTALEQEKNILKALQAGADWIQLRWKEGKKEAILELAQQVKQHCDNHQAICIINDHVDIARAIDADGVHLGLTDLDVRKARTYLAAGKIIGGTANNLKDVQQRITEQCDYIGLGPLRFTPTKEKLSPILGFTGYQEILQALTTAGIAFPPIYAIGGILEEDLLPLRDLGLYGVAISGLISTRPELIPNLKQQTNG